MFAREKILTPSAAHQLSDDRALSRSVASPLDEILEARFGRRSFLLGAATAVAAVVTPAPVRAGTVIPGTARGSGGRFLFDEITHGVDSTHHVAPGHDADVLIRWGDPVLPDAPPFDPLGQHPSAQARQFGYNNDYIGYMPLPAASTKVQRGLLCVNHEYTNAELMFPRWQAARVSLRQVDIEMAAHGISVIEVERKGSGTWKVVRHSRYNRRITAATPIGIAGPAAGHPRLRTPADPGGTRVLGTLNNCAGGVTPWGTYLAAEENFHGYFMGEMGNHGEVRNHKRYGVPGGHYAWGRFHKRFHIGHTPLEPNRFGWIVELDPHDPKSTPVKRTALGRFKHEGAEPIVNKDGRVVIYMGDDQQFEYLYKFVTERTFKPGARRANSALLDSGTLFAARFDSDGTLSWLPLTWGTGPLIPKHGFHSQADVLIETRRAADLLGATPMDRPEDVEANPVNGRVYVMLTNNMNRSPARVDAANPRPRNAYGHIIELHPPDGDHAAASCRWELLVQCGDPARPDAKARWHPATSENGWFASPDNAAVDADGRLWVATDQGRHWHLTGTADGLWGVETEGPLRGVGKMFFRVPIGAELCGPRFTPDGTTLFLAVQHPGADGVGRPMGAASGSTFEEPATRWPDFEPGMPPRPAVVAVTRKGGGRVGG